VEPGAGISSLRLSALFDSGFAEKATRSAGRVRNFGCDRDRPFARTISNGWCWLIGGGGGAGKPVSSIYPKKDGHHQDMERAHDKLDRQQTERADRVRRGNLADGEPPMSPFSRGELGERASPPRRSGL